MKSIGALSSWIVVVTLLAATSATWAQEVTVGTTLENMQAAYNGEMNAHARYLLFALQADKEGYEQVASLFRAAASAEFIHARNHAEVIAQLGGKAVATIEAPVVGTTEENLQAAIAGESYERDKMYPEFLKQAQVDRNKDAIRSLNYAKTAEAHHAALYQQALDNIEQWRQGKKDFYVCRICGETLTQLPDSKCPSCFEPVSNYTMVN